MARSDLHSDPGLRKRTTVQHGRMLRCPEAGIERRFDITAKSDWGVPTSIASCGVLGRARHRFTSVCIRPGGSQAHRHSHPRVLSPGLHLICHVFQSISLSDFGYTLDELWVWTDAASVIPYPRELTLSSEDTRPLTLGRPPTQKLCTGLGFLI